MTPSPPKKNTDLNKMMQQKYNSWQPGPSKKMAATLKVTYRRWKRTAIHQLSNFGLVVFSPCAPCIMQKKNLNFLAFLWTHGVPRLVPFAGDFTSVALLNTHESMRGDAEADLVSQPREVVSFSMMNSGRMQIADDEFLGLVVKALIKALEWLSMDNR